MRGQVIKKGSNRCRTCSEEGGNKWAAVGEKKTSQRTFLTECTYVWHSIDRSVFGSG